MILIKYLGQNRNVEPVDVVESHESSTSTSSSSSDATDVTTADRVTAFDTDVDVGDSSTISSDVDVTVADAVVSDPSTENSVNEERIRGGRLSIPGAKARKRKMNTSKADDMMGYMMENRMMLAELHTTEQSQVAQEAAYFERILKAQQEAEERGFQVMQEEQQATNQMFVQLMGTLASALNPGQPHPQPHSSTIPPWATTHPPTSIPGAWPLSHLFQQTQPTALLPVNLQHQNQHSESTSLEDEHPSTSSVLHDINRAHYYNM